ncbi:MAG: FadR/GntR family transcriptional regulator [Inquilinaceae bacterium]
MSVLSDIEGDPAPASGRRGRLSNLVSASLLDRMRAGTLKPGDVLPAEADLSREFGVSRPVVREALGQLAGLDVVQIRHGKQATVKTLSAEPLETFFRLALTPGTAGLPDAIAVRRGLEVEIAALAASHATGPQLAALAATVAEMEAQIRTVDPWVEADLRFHRTLVAASGNRLMALMVEALGSTIRESMRLLKVRRDLQTVRRSLVHHQKVLAALKRRDPIAARTAMAGHFDEVDRMVAELLAEEEGAGGSDHTGA